ncbi:MAG: dihydrodipicolinate synthase family protein [Chloroflexi bacterium]|nr:dihydrodipicolinate synthase family protein [Chloroflexota bacterium]
MMSKVEFHGIIPPLPTPMHADGSLNLAAVPALVEHVLAGGVHGLFVTGSQGEAYALSSDERVALWDAVLAAVNGRVPVMVGSGAINTRDAVELTQRAERAGADAATVGTPHFISPSQDELYAHYIEVASAVSFPVLGYSNPDRAGGLRITPATVARLASDQTNFIGIKESSGDLAETSAIIRACPADFRVFVGRDTLIYGALCYGADGAVGLAVNVAPALAVGIYEAFESGDHTRARELQSRMSALREGLSRFGTYPVWVKEALELMGIPVGPARRPILPLKPDQREKLRTVLSTAGVL